MNEFAYREINRQGWEQLAEAGCDSSQPWGAAQFASPYPLLDPEGWLPWEEIGSILCLASGGGQQAPLFAALGYKVTVLDLSPAQLQRDAAVAAERGLPIECVEGDMLDLSCLRGRQFDLVAQAISACYVPDVDRLYREVASVLRSGGWYQVEHWNSVHLQLADERWDGSAYRIERPQITGRAVPWRSFDPDHGRWTTCLHYIHPLTQLIGGICDAGFRIHRFGEREARHPDGEPGSQPHLAAFLPPFMKMLAQRV